MSMKNSNRWLLPLCLTWFCVLAASSSLAHAQATEYSAPKYQVMGIVYAPPGSASSVTYTNSNMVGSTNGLSTTNGSSNTATASVTVGASFLGIVFGASTTYSFSDEWGSSAEAGNSVAVQTTQGNSVSTMGPISSSLGVDHDNDVIYIWLNPVLSETVTGTGNSAVIGDWTGLYSNSCDPNIGPPSFIQGIDGCDPNQFPYPDIVGIPVWCLKNPYYPTPSCSQWLPYTSRSWDLTPWGNDKNTGLPLGPGLTMRDYADILHADPFVVLNGNDINVCHQYYGPSLDPNVTESVSASPLTPAQVSGMPDAGPQGVAGPRINYADPYEPSSGQLSGFWPSTCLSPNTANTGSGSSAKATMNRFEAYGTVEYPVPAPNGLPSTYSGKFEHSSTNSSTSVATDTHTVSNGIGVTVSGTIPIGLSGWMVNISTSGGYSNTSTWQQQSSLTTNSSQSWEGDYSITGPQLSDNYVGPATYNVYFDSVYGTYAFYSDLEPPATPAEMGNIGIGIDLAAICTPTVSTACTPVTPCGSAPAVATPCLNLLQTPLNVTTAQPFPMSGEYAVTLTNNSLYPITMAGPALSFSDSGFHRAEDVLKDGSDFCSNIVLVPLGTLTATGSLATNSQGLPASECQIGIIFSPAPSDMPNPVNGVTEPTLTYNGVPTPATTQIVGGVTTQVVNADMIAAGTVNISSSSAVAAEQNILMTNYAVVSGAVSGSSQGGTLVPPLITPSSTPYIYTFAAPGPEVFQFKNNFQAPAIVNQITFSDPADFSLQSDGCSGLGATVPPGGTCNFTVEYAPQGTATAIYTSISVFGTVPAIPPSPAWFNGETFQLATAGAVGGNIAFSPTSISMKETMDTGNADGQNGEPLDGTYGSLSSEIVFTNTTSLTANISYSAASGSGFSINTSATTCGSTLPAYSTCIVEVAATVTQCEPDMGNGFSASCSNSINSATAFQVASTTGTSPNLITQFNTSIPASATLLVNENDLNTNEEGHSVSPITIKGKEQSNEVAVPAINATGSLTIKPASANPVSKQGTVSATVGSFKATASYAAGATGSTVAQALAKALNVKGSLVKATASGDVVTLTSATSGTAGNLSITATGDAKFAIAASGKALAGGQNATTKTVNDAGTVKLTTNGVTASATWGATSTPQSVAQALAASVNKVAGAYWAASASGDVVTLTSVSSSTASNSSTAKAAAAQSPSAVGVTVTDTAGFSPASFAASTTN
jgi:hypothetical protein